MPSNWRVRWMIVSVLVLHFIVSCVKLSIVPSEDNSNSAAKKFAPLQLPTYLYVVMVSLGMFTAVLGRMFWMAFYILRLSVLGETITWKEFHSTGWQRLTGPSHSTGTITDSTTFDVQTITLPPTNKNKHHTTFHEVIMRKNASDTDSCAPPVVVFTDQSQSAAQGVCQLLLQHKQQQQRPFQSVPNSDSLKQELLDGKGII